MGTLVKSQILRTLIVSAMMDCGNPGAHWLCPKISRHPQDRRESAISHSSRRLQTETVGAHQWERPVICPRQRGTKLQRKDAGGRKSEQHPYHPQPKSSFLQGAVECSHQESDSTATKEHARTDHQPSQKPSSARNQPASTGDPLSLRYHLWPVMLPVSRSDPKAQK